MKKVLFVCTANICRSPMAVGIFNALAGERNLQLQVWAESAGVAALAGEPQARLARQVVAEMGVDIGEHRARQVNESMIEAAHLTLTMTPHHQGALRQSFRVLADKIHTLSDYAAGDANGNIADPYGHDLLAYRASARNILRCVELATERLQREQAGTSSIGTKLC